jgi:hypothetical protein
VTADRRPASAGVSRSVAAGRIWSSCCVAARAVFAGQEAAGQHGEVPLVGYGQQRALEIPLDQVVVRLQQ